MGWNIPTTSYGKYVRRVKGAGDGEALELFNGHTYKVLLSQSYKVSYERGTPVFHPFSVNPITYKVRRIVKRFRGGLVFKACKLVYHSTLGSRVIKKKEQYKVRRAPAELT